MSTHLPGFQSFFQVFASYMYCTGHQQQMRVKETLFVMIKIATSLAGSSNITINDSANFNSIDCISELEREENYHII